MVGVTVGAGIVSVCTADADVDTVVVAVLDGELVIDLLHNINFSSPSYKFPQLN